MKLDLQTVFFSPLLPGLGWLAAVLAATLGGYPGVICVTPLGWLLSLSVSGRCVNQTRSTAKNVRILEASLAGALFGLFTGVLFAAVLAFNPDFAIAEGGWISALATALLALCLGGGVSAVVCAVLSAAYAALLLRHDNSQADML